MTRDCRRFCSDVMQGSPRKLTLRSADGTLGEMRHSYLRTYSPKLGWQRRWTSILDFLTGFGQAAPAYQSRKIGCKSSLMAFAGCCLMAPEGLSHRWRDPHWGGTKTPRDLKDKK